MLSLYGLISSHLPACTALVPGIRKDHLAFERISRKVLLLSPLVLYLLASPFTGVNILRTSRRDWMIARSGDFPADWTEAKFKYKVSTRNKSQIRTINHGW